MSALSSGTRLGPYEITTAIGAGGMGEVYRAKDSKLGRDVAIKVLPVAFAQDPERLARFEREARVLASLNHTNIAHVYGFESATLPDGSTAHFLAMEMVAGMIMGTAAYMSPEQARGKTVDKRADTWAFGVVLYEMLTGTRLFKGETVSDTLAAVLMKDPDLSLVPPQLRGLIGKCLDRDPRKRLRDIGDLWLLLEGSKAPVTAGSNAPYRPAWVWALGALILGSAATWTLIGSTGRATATLPLVLVEPPPPGTRFVGAPLLSPDGRRLAMIAVDAAGTTRLWTRDLGEATPHAVEGSEGANTAYGVMGPFWSPDSRQIAFLAQGQIRRAAPGGGPAALVTTASPRSGVWLKDGDLLLAIPGEGLMRVPATGGSLRPASGFTTDAFRNLQIDGLDLSPDGRTLLFTQFGGETGVYAARLDGPGKRLLYPGEQSYAMFAGPDLILRPDGNVLVAQHFNASEMGVQGESFPVAPNVGPDDFAGSANGAVTYIASAGKMSRLTWFSRDGKVTGTAGPEGKYTEVTISRAGRYLGFSRTDPADGNTDIWLQALSGGAPSRLTSDPDVDHLFTISHDERHVAWEAHAKGTLNLMRRPADGSSPARLVRLWGKAGGPSDWSPDGHFVLYHSDDGTAGQNLWLVPAEGSAEPERLTQPGSGAAEGQFSPDGRYLAFSGEATGDREIYVQRVENMKLTGGPVRVSEGGGQWPQWRRDGAELYFLNRGAVMAADFHGASDRLVGAPHLLFTIAGAGRDPLGLKRNYAATPDGQRFVAIVSVDDATPHLATIILNWRASLAEKR